MNLCVVVVLCCIEFVVIAFLFFVFDLLIFLFRYMLSISLFVGLSVFKYYFICAQMNFSLYLVARYLLDCVANVVGCFSWLLF